MVTDIASHIPTLKNKPITMSDYNKDVLKGFRSGYAALLESREKLRRFTSVFDGIPIRLVQRSTRVYRALQDTSRHPDYMREGGEQDILFSSHLASNAAFTRNQISSELHDLSNGDVPYFLVVFESHDILDTRGIVSGRLLTSCKEVVLKGIESLSRRNFKLQSDLMRAALGLEAMQDWPIAGKQVTGQEEYAIHNASESFRENEFTPAEFHRKIVSSLIERAIYSDGHILWASPQISKNNQIFYINIGSLYNGLIGIALYFMKLSAKEKVSRYARIFGKILETILSWHDASKELPIGCGLFDGRSGVGLFMIAAGQHMKDSELIERGLKELLRANSECNTNNEWDVISGLSGHILALIHANRLLADPELVRAIEKAAEKILKQSVETRIGLAWENTRFSDGLPLTGFAHGAAGVSTALALAGSVCSRGAFIDAAWKAVAYENSQYFENMRNWRDNRTNNKAVDQHQSESTSLNAWCYGAAGIGLARTSLISVTRSSRDELLLKKDFDRIKNSAYTRLGNDCLCHGVLGNLACVLRVAKLTNDQKRLNDLEREIKWTLYRIAHRGPITGFGDKHIRNLYPQNPTLMCGISGIGLGVLHLLQPDQIGLILAGEMIDY